MFRIKIFAFIVIATMILGACTPAATPAPAVVPPTAVATYRPRTCDCCPAVAAPLTSAVIRFRQQNVLQIAHTKTW